MTNFTVKRTKRSKSMLVNAIIIFLAMALLLSLTACKSDNSKNEATPKEDKNTVVLKDKLFMAKLNDIYLNQEEYLGKTIKYEGMFKHYTWGEDGDGYYMVYRDSPGCCGADGQAGFEVYWSDEKKKYPKEKDWCIVEGKIESFEDDGRSFLRIRLTKLDVSSKRGLEFVST